MLLDGSVKTRTVTVVVAECREKDSLCRVWANAGRCKRHPIFMLHRCQKSCNAYYMTEAAEANRQDVNKSSTAVSAPGGPSSSVGSGNTLLKTLLRKINNMEKSMARIENIDSNVETILNAVTQMNKTLLTEVDFNSTTHDGRVPPKLRFFG